MHDELIKNLRNCSEINSLSRYKRDLMKQAADTIEELQKDLERSKDFEAFWQHEAEEALKRFQVTISNKPRWIPVEERLPEHSGFYIIFQVGGSYGQLSEVKIAYWDSRNFDGGMMVTHWMPLPQPPEDK